MTYKSPFGDVSVFKRPHEDSAQSAQALANLREDSDLSHPSNFAAHSRKIYYQHSQELGSSEDLARLHKTLARDRLALEVPSPNNLYDWFQEKSPATALANAHTDGQLPITGESSRQGSNQHLLDAEHVLKLSTIPNEVGETSKEEALGARLKFVQSGESHIFPGSNNADWQAYDICSRANRTWGASPCKEHQVMLDNGSVLTGALYGNNNGMHLVTSDARQYNVKLADGKLLITEKQSGATQQAVFLDRPGSKGGRPQTDFSA